MAVFNKQIYEASKKSINSSSSNPIASNKNNFNGGTLIFPDGARLSYQNVTEKNIYAIVNKYSNFLRPDTTAVNSKIKYKLGRLALIFKDGDAVISIGKINSMGFEYVYKMNYLDDNNLSAIYYYPAKNYEEVTIKSGKCTYKSYNALHQLVKIEEVENNCTNIYEINPETNDIKCLTI